MREIQVGVAVEGDDVAEGEKHKWPSQFGENYERGRTMGRSSSFWEERETELAGHVRVVGHLLLSVIRK